MIGTAISILRNAPQIIAGVNALTPKKWHDALNKVKAGALVAGSMTTASAQPWTVDSGLHELVRVGLLLVNVPPEIALPAAPVVATGITFVATTGAAYIVGWATPEKAEALRRVKPR